MKYIVRLLAAVPVVGAGIATITFMCLAFDNHIWCLAFMCSVCTMLECVKHYEDTVRDFAIYLRTIAKDAMEE